MNLKPNRSMNIQDVPLELLKHDPKNPRIHPEDNLRSIMDSLERFGQTEPLLVQESTGMVIAGNGRLAAMRKLGWEEAKCNLVEVTDKTAREMAFVMNRTGELARWDQNVLQDILPEFSGDLLVAHGGADLLLAEMPSLDVDSLLSNADQVREEHKEMSTGAFTVLDIDDARFEADDEWGIPLLLDGNLGDVPPDYTYCNAPEDGVPLFLFRSIGTDRMADGVVAFYKDDERFESVWSRAKEMAHKFHAAGVKGLVAPDFSIWLEAPKAEWIWNVYRSRKVARYWQELGFMVYPNLSICLREADTFVIDTLPDEIPVAVTQCRSLGGDTGKAMFLDSMHAYLTKKTIGTLVIYGGEEHRPWVEPYLREHGLMEGTEFRWFRGWTQGRNYDH